MKKTLWFWMLGICMLFFISVVTVPAETTVDSGDCGENVTWVLTDDGVLTISGEGKMNNFTSSAQPWKDYTSDITKVVIEDGITNIGDYAFQRCSSITDISIPDSVQSIGWYAFYGCSSLNNVVLPEGVKLLDNYTFYGCTSMRNIHLPSTLKEIRNYVFGECVFEDLVIPEGVTHIGSYAFYICDWNSLSLPDSLVWMGEYVFSNAAGMRGIVTTPKNVTNITIGEYCMCGNISGIILADGVKNISQNAFRYCYFKEIWIPASVTSIDANAFYGMKPAEITIYGYKGTTAETYATDNGFIFVSLDEEIVVDKTALEEAIALEEAADLLEADYTYVSWKLYIDALNTARTVLIDEEATQELVDDAVTALIEAKLALEKREIVIVAQPSDCEGGVGENVSFTVVAEGEGLSYQWYYKNTTATKWYACSGEEATTATISVPVSNSKNGRQYYCKITDAAGNEVSTEPAVLNVIERIVIDVIQEPQDCEGGVGENVSFTVVAEGEGLSYQWYYKNATATKWYACSGEEATTATISVPVSNSKNGRQYYCKITDAAGNEVSTEPAVLNVVERIVITVIQQPQDCEGGIGETVSFTVLAEGEGLSYQWYYKNATATKWYACSGEEAITEKISVPVSNSKNGRQYYCKITDATGNEVSTDPAILNVVERVVITISQQPQDCEGGVGENVSFTVLAEGEGLSYQWYYKNATAKKWYVCSGADATTETISVPVSNSKNGRQYYCKITDATGNEVSTEPAVLNVVERIIINITQQPQDCEGEIGESVLFTVVAEGEGLSYQWYYKNATATKWYACSGEGATTATLTVPVSRSKNGRQYYCHITDSVGNIVKTESATLNVKQESVDGMSIEGEDIDSFTDLDFVSGNEMLVEDLRSAISDELFTDSIESDNGNLFTDASGETDMGELFTDSQY